MRIEKDFVLGHEYMDGLLALPRRCQDIFMTNVLSMTDNEDSNAIMDFISCVGFDPYMNLKSPIEQIFGFVYDIVRIDKYGFIDSEIYGWESQKEIITAGCRYYADFHFCVPCVSKTTGSAHVLVECDGHDFHERTKNQVEYGNNRDFNLKNAGYEVIHFSGSQIYKDPFSCAEKVLMYLNNIMVGNNGR